MKRIKPNAEVYAEYKYVKGEQIHTAKLKENDVREIRKLYTQGYGYRKIAKMYNVLGRCIADIITGKSWKHVK